MYRRRAYSPAANREDRLTAAKLTLPPVGAGYQIT